jgi:RNA recognition motif-containing protein
MNSKLYVGNLNYQTTEEQLRQIFSEVAPVASVALITDRETGRPKGFGFVEMETSEGAREAIEKLNNREVDSRTITVSEARPKKEFGGGGRGGDGGFGGGRGGYGGGGGGRRRY